MNKTKILTSLSALAAVFVFNGNAMAAVTNGVYNPSCKGNEYTITIVYGGVGFVKPSEDECKSGEECMPECPANNSVYTDIYGNGVTFKAPVSDCSGTHTYTGWKLQGVSVKLGGNAVPFSEVSIAAGAEIKDEYYFYNGQPVDDGSSFQLVPAGVNAKTVSVDLQCTFEGDGLPSSVTPVPGTNAGGNVGDTISFTDNCKASGYTINKWQYRLKGGDGKWSLIDGTSFTIPDIGAVASATYEFRPENYVGNTYNMVLKKGKSGTETQMTLKYTNPVEDAAGTWKSGTETVTSGVNLPILGGYTLRGMVKSNAAIAVITQDASRLEGKVILRSSATANTSAALPDLGVVTTNGTFYPAWATNCDPVESAGGLPTATCELKLNHTTGSVTYTNACAAGFNTLKTE